MADEAKLKPCLSCGGRAYITSVDNGDFRIACWECNHSTQRHNSVQAAINDWNNRPAQDKLIGILEASERDYTHLLRFLERYGKPSLHYYGQLRKIRAILTEIK